MMIIDKHAIVAANDDIWSIIMVTVDVDDMIEWCF